MTIDETIHGHVAVLSLKGNLLGEPEITKLRETIYRLAERNQTQIVVDLGGVKAINSTGLGALVAALVSLRTRKGQMHLARSTDKVQSLIMITRLFKVFKIYETVERAVADLEG